MKNLSSKYFGTCYAPVFFSLILILSLSITSRAQELAAVNFSPTIDWNCYTGGNSFDEVKGIHADYNGNIYTTGFMSQSPQTGSLNFLNAYQGGMSDAFLCKFAKEGGLIWAIYIGGESSDFGTSIAELPNGNIVVVGYTSSQAGFDFNVTPSSLTGGGADGFCAVYSPSGELVWSTYFSGNNDDIITQVAIGPNGKIYLCGNTKSMDFPYATHFQPVYGGGVSDGFIAEMNDNGSVSWFSYVGGLGSDYVNDITVGDNGRVFFCGKGYDNVIVSNQDLPIENGGASDAFIGCVYGNTIQWGHYVGGEGADSFHSITSTPQGKVIVAGYTSSDYLEGFETSSDVFPNQFDIMVASYTWAGELEWHSYIYGIGDDKPSAVTADGMGNIYLAANTDSDDLEIINGLYSENNGGKDSYVAKFAQNGNVVWSTYLGGINDDFSAGIVIDRFGKIVLGGNSQSGNMENSIEGYAYQGATDGTIIRISECNNPMIEIHALSDTTLCEGYLAQFCAGGGQHYVWTNQDTTALTFEGNEGYIYARGSDSFGCSALSNRIMITVLEKPSVEAIALGPIVICGEGELELIADGAETYVWTDGSTEMSMIVTESGTYSVLGTAENGCRDKSENIDVIFVEEPQVSIAIAETVLCISDGQTPMIALPLGGEFVGNGAAGNNFDPLVSGGGVHQVSYNFTDEYGCFSNSDTIEVSVFYPTMVTFETIDESCLTGSPVVLEAFPSGGSFEGDGVLDNVFTPSAAGTGPQNIIYTYIDENNCINTANEVIYIDACTGVNNDALTAELITIYPNPTDDVINFKLNRNEKSEIAIYNNSGQLIGTWTAQQSLQVDTSNWASGDYTAHVKVDVQQQVFRFIIQH